MNWGPPQPPGVFPPPSEAGGYFDLAIAFGILFAIFVTTTCCLTLLLLYFFFKRMNTSNNYNTRGFSQFQDNPNYGS